MTRKLIDDCFVHDSQRLSHAGAIALLKSRVTTTVEIERVALAEAHGRTLANDAVARAPVPAHRNSAVDGYSFDAADSTRAAADGLIVAGRQAAGGALAADPPAHAAVRIFTGAAVPAGHDTVAMQEDCTLHEAEGHVRVRIPAGLKPGANVRKAGEDVTSGTTVARAGSRLRPQDAAALASVGLADVDVYQRLSVALVSTGDEVQRLGATLAPGQVHDANGPMLAGLVRAAGADAHDLGIVGDDLAALKNRLAQAAEIHDLILTSGGASKGEEDHLLEALDQLGQRHLWQLAIKPGRPMMFGQIGRCAVVGLPGNPVAAFVCFLMYVAPLIGAMGGQAWREPRRIPLPARFDIVSRKTGRREFLRGVLVDADGTLGVDKFGRDGSGLISGLQAADGLIDVPEDVASVRRGDIVRFIPFSAFGILAA